MAKIFYFIASISLSLWLIFSLTSFDIINDWFLPFSLIVLILLFIIATYNIKRLFLLLILIFPTAFKFNYYKIDLSRYLFLKDYDAILINPISLLYLATIIVGFITIITNWQKIKQIPLKYIILLFTSYVILSISWSGYKSISVISAIYFLIPFVMYIISYVYFPGIKNLIKIIIFSIISSIVPILIAIHQIVTKDYFFEQDSSLGRIIGTFAHPNSFGLYLFVILSLIVSFYLAKKDKKIEKNILITAYSVVTIIIFVMTYSRVSWTSFAIFLILFTFIENKLLILWSALAPIATFIFIVSENIRSRIIEITSLSIYSSWASRKSIWEVAWKEFLKKPLFGHGVGISETVIEKAKSWQGGSSLPHNDILLHALELGIAGIVLFCFYTFGAIYYALKTYFNIPNGYQIIKIFKHKIEIKVKTICFGVLIILLASMPSIIFESISQKIITQIIIWSILGSLFTLKKTSNKQNVI